MDTTLDLATLFEQAQWDQDTLTGVKEAAFASPESLNRLLELLSGLETKARDGSTGPAEALKIGACYLMLAEPAKAAAWLEKAAPGATRSRQLGIAYRELGRLDEAAGQFENAAQAGGDALECEMERALCLIHKGDLPGARAIVDARSAAGHNSADWEFVRGRLLQESGDFAGAMAAYEAALAINQSHALAMFHQAYLLDLYGSDEQARELYLRCSELPYVYTHALINLAIIHEDNGEYDRAAACLRRVLAVNPNHPRAQLYLKDVIAATKMYIDEHQLRAMEKRDAVLDIPVTDFELSVRSRNCLKKMNINTLGDLLQITEAELLAYKNFGETSLREIKAMLAQKGLSLGQNAEMRNPDLLLGPPVEEEAGQSRAELLSRPVMSLNLSVRSRKCLQRLGLNTIGELVSKSQEELLESQNFGQTSLKEIKDRLEEVGLRLRSHNG